jgi:hypothetical protein
MNRQATSLPHPRALSKRFRPSVPIHAHTSTPRHARSRARRFSITSMLPDPNAPPLAGEAPATYKPGH